MDSVLYSWLGVAAIAPFVTLLSTWTAVVFFSYKRRWRLTEVFLCAFAVHEIVYSMFGFGYAVLNIIKPVLDTPCSFIIWGLTASRVFHLSAMTSMLLDRALSSKFSYTYRCSVRKSQVQYHLAVLGVVAVFVGVTSVFARTSPVVEGVCSFHPLAWNFKFTVFLCSVYGMLLAAGFACCFSVTLFGMTDDTPFIPGPGTNWESGNSTNSSKSSHGLKETIKSQKEEEWRTVASVCWLSYFVNHAPFLAVTIMGILVPTFWSAWLDNITVWMSLAQSIMVPLLLLAMDLPHRTAVMNLLLQRGRIYRHLSDTSGFLMQVADGSNTKAGMSPNVMMCPPNYYQAHNFLRVPQRIRWTPNSLPCFQPPYMDNQKSRMVIRSSDDSISKSSSRCLSPLPPRNYDIYSSLDSSCYTLLSLRSCSSGSSSISSKYDDDDGLSITTNALDDFVFHDGHAETNNTNSVDVKMKDQFKNVNIEETQKVDVVCDHSLLYNKDCLPYRQSSFDKLKTSSSDQTCRLKLNRDRRSSYGNLPNFSNSNLVFLSPKPLQERCVSMRSLYGSNDRINCIPGGLVMSRRELFDMRPAKLPESNLFKPAGPSPITSISNKPKYGSLESTDANLIIYSEYL